MRGKTLAFKKRIAIVFVFFLRFGDSQRTLLPKILRVVNLLCVVFLLSLCDLLSRRTLCGHHFPGNYRHFPSPRRVRGVVNLGGVVKTLRRSNSLFLCYRRSIFSTEGSFGLPSVPGLAFRSLAFKKRGVLRLRF